MQNATLVRPNIDACTACDQEPIHAPGSIQPHGFLLALAADGTIIQASDNLQIFTGRDVQDTLGQSLQAVIGTAALPIQAALGSTLPGSRPEYCGSVRLGSGRCFDVLAHRHDDLLILEFEEVAREGAADFRALYPSISRFLTRLGDADGVADMSDLALRAPLRHIACYCDLLLDADNGSESAERRHHFLSNIKESARFAGRLVDDLLGFSHMGRAPMRASRLNMRDLFNATLDRLKPEIGTRRIDGQTDPLPEVEADPNLLQLAVCNLLANAIKYTSTRDIARICVYAEREPDDDGFIVFHIEDNGVGFSMEYAHKLFGVFQRLHPTEAFDGTGIGLANVRRIIERHGGRVWAISEPDRGARFSFSLPALPSRSLRSPRSP